MNTHPRHRCRVWMTAAIGIACGLGREMAAVVLALGVLALVPKLVDRKDTPAGGKP